MFRRDYGWWGNGRKFLQRHYRNMHSYGDYGRSNWIDRTEWMVLLGIRHNDDGGHDPYDRINDHHCYVFWHYGIGGRY